MRARPQPLPQLSIMESWNICDFMKMHDQVSDTAHFLRPFAFHFALESPKSSKSNYLNLRFKSLRFSGAPINSDKALLLFTFVCKICFCSLDKSHFKLYSQQPRFARHPLGKLCNKHLYYNFVPSISFIEPTSQCGASFIIIFEQGSIINQFYLP